MTETIRKNLAEYLRKASNAAKRKGARSVLSRWFGWLFSYADGAAIMFGIRARPFIDFTQEDRAKLMEYWAHDVREAAAGGPPAP